MSFLGCIGHLMQGSGLTELLETEYASNAVVHMLNGKEVASQLPTEDQGTEFSHDTNEVLDDPRKQ